MTLFFCIIEILKSLKMKPVATAYKYSFVFMMVFMFAFAKAYSQSSSLDNDVQTFSINQDFDKDQIFDLLNTLRSKYALDVKLTAYAQNGSKLKKLGISMKGDNGEWMEHVANDSNGIDPVCMEISKGVVNYINSCSNAVTESSVQTIQSQDLTANRNQLNREKQLDSLRQIAELKKEERLSTASAQVAEYMVAQNDQLAAINAELRSETDLLKIEKSTQKAELQSLQIEVNTALRERQTLDYNNTREKARRDSLQAQQLRLLQQLETQQKELEKAVALKAANEAIIKQQQEVIESQWLKSETAESLKAYRTAMLGVESGDQLLSKGYLIFSQEQCLFKVFQDYTIVYGNQGNFLFTINEELGTKPQTGSLKIKGESYTYTFTGNVLYIKDDSGNLINQYGEILSTVNRF